MMAQFGVPRVYGSGLAIVRTLLEQPRANAENHLSVRAVEEESEWLIAACVGSCWQSSAADWSTCTDAVGEDGGECTTYINAATTSCPASIVDAGACSGNQPDGGVTLIYFALAQTFCE